MSEPRRRPLTRSRRLGSRRRRGREETPQEESASEVAPKAIYPYRHLVYILLSVLCLTALHLGTNPLERALGLAHGQQISSPQTEFLVFDHLTPEGAETLNRSLFMDTQGSHEVVVVQGYGLWRFGLMLAICYALTLFLSRELLKLQLKFSLKSDISIDRNHRMLLAVLIGVGVSLLGLGNVAPTLFTLAFLRLLVLSNKSQPNEMKVQSSVELLDTVRALWAGWLVPTAMTSTSPWSDATTLNFAGLLLGCALSYLLFLGLWGRHKTLFSSEQARSSLISSFEFGCLETLAVLSVCTASYRAGSENLAGTVMFLGCFGFARVAQATLLRRIYTMPYCGRVSTRLESLYRVAAGVWFLLPLPLGPIFFGYDQPALMVWLTGLVPLVTAGRPWGSLSPAAPRTNEFMNAPVAESTVLTPRQKAAVLFMSLPPELTAKLFSELGPEEVQAITLEITQLPSISPRLRQTVIQEFRSSGSSPVYCGVTLSAIEQSGNREQKPKPRRGKKRHHCVECGEVFNHGIGLRKHQRLSGHRGSQVVQE